MVQIWKQKPSFTIKIEKLYIIFKTINIECMHKCRQRGLYYSARSAEVASKSEKNVIVNSVMIHTCSDIDSGCIV